MDNPGLSETSRICLLPQRLTHCNLHKTKETVTDFIPFLRKRLNKRSLFQTLRRKLKKKFAYSEILENSLKDKLFIKGEAVLYKID